MGKSPKTTDASGIELLSTISLSSGYGSLPIVQDVSFSLYDGQILAIAGRNGVGKSTLIKTLAGQIKVATGEIIFKDNTITKLDALKRSRMGIGYVPQGRGIFGQLSVKDNLCMGELVGGDPSNTHYEEVYHWFPFLRARARQKAGSLSGGEQQMLSIGRVLIGNPKILLLDEPSEGIQPSIVHEIGEVIRKQNETQGLSIILVEQNIDLIRAAAHWCLIMDKGKIITEIHPKELEDPETARRYLAV